MVLDKEAIENSADEFVSTIRRLMPKYDSDYILNTDQSGIQLEYHSSRTLSYRGEKMTTVSVRSKNAVSHSFTVQPLISLNGYLIGPLFLCLKEPSGYLSENVQVNISVHKRCCQYVERRCDTF